MGRGYRGQVFSYGEHLVVKRIPIKHTKDFEAEKKVGLRAGKFCVGPMIHQFHCENEYCYLVMDRVTPVALQQKDREEVIRLFEKAIRYRIVNLDGEFARTDDGNLVMYDFGVSSIAKSAKEAKVQYEEYLEQFHCMMGVDGVYNHFFSSGK